MRAWLHSSSSGYAAVIVIWGVSALAIVALNISKGQRQTAVQAVNTMESLQASQLASSGIDVAAHWLQSEGADSAEDLAAGRTVTLEGIGEIQVTGSPSQARLDLNRAPADWMAGLFAEAGLSPSRAENLAAEILATRESEKRSHRQPKPTFRSVYELRIKVGVTKEELAKLIPYVTVYSDTPRVHLAAASDVVVKSVPGLNGGSAVRLVATRNLKSVQNEADASLNARFTVKMGPVYHLNLEGRTMSGAVARRTAIISLSEGEDGGYAVLAYGAGVEATP